MRIVILISTILLTTLSFQSCKDGSAEKQKIEYDALFKEVMRVHDAVMPETSNLYKLKKYAQENIDVLPKDNELVKQLLDTKIKADEADEAMMDWMAEFRVPETSHAEKIDYLNQELKSISAVSELMLSTLKNGKAIVRKSDKYIKENNLRPDAKPTVLRPANK